MQLPKSFTDELRARVPISDVIGKRVKLIRAGREFKACCPFHKEKTPSFTVNDSKGFFHCFGCGASGDVISFLMKHDNLSFMDAIEQLASLAGMQVPKPTPQEQKRFQQQMSLYDVMALAADYYQRCLHDPKHKKILGYLLDRGLSLETIKSFKLGFAPLDDLLLIQKLKENKYNSDLILESALFRKSERRDNEIYPFFRGRIMFPVEDTQGRVIAFGGRILPEAYGGPADKSAPKYINSAETAIFHKGKILYGLSRARKPLGDGATAIVVEGYMDVIALHQAGFLGAVAPLGTALTETQIEELWRVLPEGKKSPVLCFDGDAAGQRAAARSLERATAILKPDQAVRFAFLPPEHDPDSLIKAEGAAAMRAVVDRAIGVFDMMWNEESKGRSFDQPEARAGFKRALEKRIHAISDNNVKEFFFSHLNKRVDEIFLSDASDRSRGNKFAGGFKKGQRPDAGALRPLRAAPPPVRGSRLALEKALLATLINYPALFDELAEDLGRVPIAHPDYERLRHAVVDLLLKDNHEITLDDQAVKQHLIGLGFERTLESLFDRQLYLQAGFARPGQPLEVVRDGWREAYQRGVHTRRWTHV